MPNTYSLAQIKYNATKRSTRSQKIKSRHTLTVNILTQQSCPNQNAKESDMPSTEQSSQIAYKHRKRW